MAQTMVDYSTRNRPPTRPRSTQAQTSFRASLLDFLASRSADRRQLPRRFNVHLTIDSTRFGTLEVAAEAVIEFPDGLIGLGGSRYALLARDETAPSCGCNRSTIPRSRCR